MIRRSEQNNWLVHASAALRGALAAGDYDAANHLLAAIEAACERGGDEASKQALADTYLLLDRVHTPSSNRSA